MEKSFSNKITCGRFIMMIGVVIIHCNVINLTGYNGPSILTNCIDIISYKFASVCVPWFFFISSYLIGQKYHDIDSPTYKSLIYKRIKSILIPYLLWNTIAFLIREGVNLSPLSKYTSGGHIYESPVNLIRTIFIDPEVVPLWFLRNLFLFVILSPLIQRLLRFNAIIALVLLWVINQYADTFFGGIFYYGLGFVCADRFSPDRLERWLTKFAILLPVICILMIIEDRYLTHITFCNDILIIGGMFSVWGAACSLIHPVGPISAPDNIFFIYACHGIISPYILKSLDFLFNFSGYYWLLCYIAAIVLVVAITYALAIVTKSISPHFFAILTGSRHKKYLPL